jgi:hypothetical protein
MTGKMCVYCGHDRDDHFAEGCQRAVVTEYCEGDEQIRKHSACACPGFSDDKLVLLPRREYDVVLDAAQSLARTVCEGLKIESHPGFGLEDLIEGFLVTVALWQVKTGQFPKEEDKK